MCGIVGTIGTTDASRECFLGLTTLQHRGQDGAGILSYDHSGFHLVKGLGLVESVFTREGMESLSGEIAVGHNRYSTIGRGDQNDLQPLIMSYPFGLGMVHNGNIVNCGDLATELRTKWKRNLLTQSDSEVVLNFLAKNLAQDSQANTEDLDFSKLCSAVEEIFERVHGSYSIVTLVADQGLLAFRDPYGIRPLSWGVKEGNLKSKKAFMVASESVALEFNGYREIKSLEPGEILFIDQKGKVHQKVVGFKDRRHCMFEWVYFASPESVIDQTPVYGSRINLGKHLAGLIKKKIKSGEIDADVIVPVPETSRIAAISLSEELGIPYRELLIKNRYIKRTFILESTDKRQKAVNLKLSPVKSEIKGKKIILVDDSIVRGTTSKKLIELVRSAGAEKVYFVSTCPPIRFPCYYGIDFPDRKELIAHDRDLSAIEKHLGADGVVYQEMDDLLNAIVEMSVEVNQNSKFKKPCMACLTGDYPADVQSGAGFAENRERDRAKSL